MSPCDLHGGYSVISLATSALPLVEHAANTSVTDAQRQITRDPVSVRNSHMCESVRNWRTCEQSLKSPVFHGLPDPAGPLVGDFSSRGGTAGSKEERV